jgi:disulfide bond formation protein DsbB
MTTLVTPAGRSQTLASAFLALAMAATVGTAIGFERIGGYIPCMLCLEQRIPYYVGVPLMALALAAGLFKLPGIVVRSLLFVGGALMLYGLGLAVYHSGVEWGFWAGPSACGAVAGSVDTGNRGVLDSLDAVVPPSCDRAAGRFLGLSFAGWNVLASLVLAIVALRAAFARA